MEDQNQNKRTTMFSRNKTEDLSSMIYGKIPPSAVPLEQSVLGICLTEKNAFSEISSFLKAEMFYKDAHVLIFSAMLELVNNSDPTDLLTVSERLRKNGKLEEAGATFYLSQLTNMVDYSANIETHARIIFQKWMGRKMIQISNDIIRDSFEDTTDVFDIRDSFIIQMEQISSSIQSGVVTDGLQVINKIKKNLINPPERPKYVEVILGIKHLLGTVDCYAAKPGTGKTEILVESALLEAQRGNKVGILSLELHPDLLMAKMLHHYTGVFANKIIENDVHGEYLEKILSQDYSVMQNIIIDGSKTTNLNIRSKIIWLVKQGCRQIWIDYIQLCKMIREYIGQTDVACMESMMHTLQGTAKELECSIIPLSQLKRGKEEPTMEDIRGGGIEAACSKIFLVEDPNIKTNYNKAWEDIEVNRGLIEFVNVKERFGDKGKIQAYYDKPRQRIMLWNDRDNGSFLSEFKEGKPPILKDNFDIF